MSARILYSLTDDKAGGGANKHVGCMNGIFQLFECGQFLPRGRRLSASGRKSVTAGQNENCGAEEDQLSIKSIGKVSKATASPKERHRLSTDSSRSSVSSSCNSSSFSSIEDHKSFKIEPVNSTENRTKDLPRLQKLRTSKGSGENSLPKSATMMYVDSPRPVAPSKVVSESLRDLCSLSGPGGFVDSPRFSCDRRESRDEIKSRMMNLEEQPRHSLDSKRSTLLSLSLKVQQQQEDPESWKWQSSVVAKLMGLEAAPNMQASSKPQPGHGRSSSVDGLDPFSVSSRTANADLVVRLKPNVTPVLNKGLVASKESPLQSPTLSVYGELEKRLEQIEFKRSGKDLRALKQILEAMQRSEQPEDDKKKIISRSEFTAKFADCSSMKSAGSVTSHEVGKPTYPGSLRPPHLVVEPDISFRNGISGLPKIQVSKEIQRNSSDQQRTDDLTLRASPRQAHSASRSGISTYRTEDRRKITEGIIPGRNFGDSSPRPLRKKLEPTNSCNRSNHLGRQSRQSQPPGRVPKSKVRGDPSGGNSGKLTEQSNHISTQSADDRSFASLDKDMEVTSSYLAKREQTAKKALRRSNVAKESPGKSGTTLAEQPSPVSVLDSSYLEDKSPSPVKMISEAFGDEGSSFHGKRLGLHASEDLFPGEKPQAQSTYSDHPHILQTLSSSGLPGNLDAGNLTIRLHLSGAIMTNPFATPGHNKLSDNRPPAEDLSEGCLDRSQSKRRERIQRKLLFDIIDEIMVQKLTSDNHGNRFFPRSLAAKKTGQEQLLKGLRSEIAHLQADNSKCDIDCKDEDFIQTILPRDLERESQSWNGCYDDSCIVLDIERWIFKDLVTEVVTGIAAGLRNGLTSYCRQMGLK